MKEEDFEVYYGSLESIYVRALDDVRWHLDRHFQELDASDVARIYSTAKLTQRVKSKKSLWRKCRRDNLASVEEIPVRIGDLLGIRIATPNKEQARLLFEHFRSVKDDWFCEVSRVVEFVPYTIADKNRYSLEKGYQAYHVTFSFESSYAPATPLRGWPVEIQIMSQLWEFWAEYSRKYFYGGKGTMADALLPYNVTISRILDAADELMIATADLLLMGEGEEQEPQELAEEEGRITVEAVRMWIRPNLPRYFGRGARMPIDLFLSKIAEELNLYDVTLEDLSEILADEDNQRTYDAILRESRVEFLPPYQHILCRILIRRGLSLEDVVTIVNKQLWLLGIELRLPEDANG